MGCILSHKNGTEGLSVPCGSSTMDRSTSLSDHFRKTKTDAWAGRSTQYLVMQNFLKLQTSTTSDYLAMPWPSRSHVTCCWVDHMDHQGQVAESDLDSSRREPSSTIPSHVLFRGKKSSVGFPPSLVIGFVFGGTLYIFICKSNIMFPEDPSGQQLQKKTPDEHTWNHAYGFVFHHVAQHF